MLAIRATMRVGMIPSKAFHAERIRPTGLLGLLPLGLGDKAHAGKKAKGPIRWIGDFE